MEPLRSVKNQYLGVNAHLQSYWQAVGGWSRFHTNHITDLLRSLRPLLIPLGYDADIEPSLQIRRLDDAEPAREYGVIAIYEYVPGKLDRGELIVRIELLSPSNKPGGRDAQEYFEKRLTVLESGIVVVEIDYLHDSAPTLRGLPSYRPRSGQSASDSAHAYRIAVIDPHPDMRRGVIRLSGFDVDAPLPDR